MYMESGYLDLLSTAPCNINTPRPAVLHYSAATSAYIQSNITPLQGAVNLSTDETLDEFPFTGQALENGSRSKAVGCPDSAKSLTYTDECDTVYTIPEEELALNGFCPVASVLGKKRAQGFVPASMFSGKLRLMVQAIYGSKRSDYSLVEIESTVVPGKLNIGAFTLSAFHQPSYGLFTTADYDYFLVEVTGQVSYYPLILSPVALEFVEILKTHPRNNEPAFVKKIEAYILSTAKIDKDNVIVGSTLSGLTGEPLSYGWHWSWNGHQADIVLHTSNTTNHYYDVVHYHLAIARADGVFSETLTAVETGHWFPQHLSGIAVFFPNYFSNNFEAKPPVWADLNNGIPVPQTTGSIPLSPLHCFRSMSDELIIVRHESALSVNNDVIVETVDYGCSDEDIFTTHNVTNNGVLGTTTLQINDFSYNGTASNIRDQVDIHAVPVGGLYPEEYSTSQAGNYTRLSNIMCGGMRLDEYLVSTGYFGWHPSGGIGTSYDPVTRLTYGLRHYSQDRIQTIEQSSFNVRMNTEIFLQLPFYDCASVLWGYRDITIKTNYITGQHTIPREMFGGTAIWQFRLETDGTYTPLSEVVPPKLSRVESIGGFNLVYNTPVNIHVKIGYANLYRYNGTDGNELIHTETSSNPLSAYFDISYLNYPYIDQFDWVKTDTSGGYKFSYKATASDDAKYPGDSAVGWV